jgi:hypothetical protein
MAAGGSWTNDSSDDTSPLVPSRLQEFTLVFKDTKKIGANPFVSDSTHPLRRLVRRADASLTYSPVLYGGCRVAAGDHSGARGRACRTEANPDARGPAVDSHSASAPDRGRYARALSDHRAVGEPNRAPVAIAGKAGDANADARLDRNGNASR